jgi:hypothetical protein
MGRQVLARRRCCYALFECETVVRFAWLTLPARVGPLTATDIEPTLSHVAWDGADPSQAGCGGAYGLRIRLFVVAGWGEAVRSVPVNQLGTYGGNGDDGVEPAEPAGPA